MVCREDSAGTESNSSLPNRLIISSAFFKTWNLLMENTLHTSSVCRPQYKHTISFVWHVVSQSIAKCRWQSSLATLRGQRLLLLVFRQGSRGAGEVRSCHSSANGINIIYSQYCMKHRNPLRKKLQFCRARLQSLGHPGRWGWEGSGS